MRWLSVWCNVQATLARQRVQVFSKVFVATKPGKTVSVDQMTSTEVGFFAQLKGALTKKRYRCCTIFVDNYSRLRYLHLQVNNTAKETMKANTHLRNMRPSMVSPSSTITATMDALPTICSNSHARETASSLPSVASMHISKMGLRSAPFVTSPTARARNFSTLTPNGQLQSTLPCGHMPSGMLPSSTIAYQC
jgi:hypothetical protein